jgi:heme a synthase
MDKTIQQRNNKQVASWLLIGVAMIMIQVVIGGITRLTESGLSITEWKPVTGALPPLNDADWQTEFNKYRTTDQFKYVHQHFSLADFKFIFFWEWFHRLWARLLGVVFLAGFIYFIARKKLSRQMITPMIVLFLLGALQGLVGWLMVKSGLVPEKFYVGHIELTTHLISAIILLAYTAWFAFSLLPSMQIRVEQHNIRNYLFLMAGLFFFQLMYGGFMAGLKAGAMAPTWPDINGNFFPPAINDLSPWAQNLINNPIGIHFIHRGLAYILLLVVLLFFVESKKIIHAPLFSKLSKTFALLLMMQVLLGIFTLLNATDKAALVWFGVSHQLVAMLLVLCLTALLFMVQKPLRSVL